MRSIVVVDELNFPTSGRAGRRHCGNDFLMPIARISRTFTLVFLSIYACLSTLATTTDE
jgi:hypothetical protein